MCRYVLNISSTFEQYRDNTDNRHYNRDKTFLYRYISRNKLWQPLCKINIFQQQINILEFRSVNLKTALCAIYMFAYIFFLIECWLFLTITVIKFKFRLGC